MQFSTVLSSLALVKLSVAGYAIKDDYSGANFFNMFNFHSGGDPTHGFVDYVDQNTAQNTGLINTNNGKAYMGVDYSNVTPSGRPAVRIESKNTYNSGLIVIDLEHMPGGICGTWPAFWAFGDNWPDNGEIDIIEGVNEETTNAMTLHTGPGCSILNNGGFMGSISTPNCDVNAAGQSANAGCGIKDPSSSSYGAGVNAVGGGVWATEITSDHIAIWHFNRGNIPSDLASGNPNPSNWGMANAKFSGACNIDSKFNDLRLTFTNTFCGDWAGNVWSSGSCASKANTCNDFVQNNPSAFRDNYWSVNSIKVFEQSTSSASAESVANASAKQPEPVASAVEIPATTLAPVVAPATSQAAEQAPASTQQEAPAPFSTSAAAAPPAETQTQSQTPNNNDSGHTLMFGDFGTPAASSSAAPSVPEVTAAPAPSTSLKPDDGRVLMFDDFPKEKSKHRRHLMKHMRHGK